MNFWQELRRRKVIRVAIVYAITAWLLAQIGVMIFDTYGAPDWVQPVFVGLLGLGFPVALVLAWALEVTPDGVRPTSSASTALSPGRSRLDYTLIGLVVLAVVWLLYRTEIEQPDAPDYMVVAEENTGPQVLHNSIAVLPFDNLSPDPDNAFFAAGTHEEILNHLAKIKDLSVIARTTMIRYTGSEKSVPEIGRELNVGAVMEGSVRYAGELVRVTAQLIDVETGAHLWSEAYDRELEDVFSIQSDIAFAITTAMKAEFSIEEQQAIAKRPTENIAAYGQYVQALLLLGQVPMPVDDALVYLDAAIELDPEFALALAMKAQSYGVMATGMPNKVPYTAQSQQMFADLSIEFAERALAVDPELANAYTALKYAADAKGNWSDALAYAKKAYDLNPNVSTAAYGYGTELAFNGNAEEGVQLIDRAMALDPLNVAFPYFASGQMGGIQRWEDSIRYARQAISMMGGNAQVYINAATSAFQMGDRNLGEEFVASALAHHARAPDGFVLVQLMTMSGMLGRQDDVLRYYEEIKTIDMVNPLNDFQWFLVNLELGKTDTALDYLERGVASGFPPGAIKFVTMQTDHPFLATIRDNPRFQAIITTARTANHN
jgi:TolB-like protein/Flp pilus assembly protein TadD